MLLLFKCSMNVTPVLICFRHQYRYMATWFNKALNKDSIYREALTLPICPLFWKSFSPWLKLGASQFGGQWFPHILPSWTRIYLLDNYDRKKTKHFNDVNMEHPYPKWTGMELTCTEFGRPCDSLSSVLNWPDDPGMTSGIWNKWIRPRVPIFSFEGSSFWYLYHPVHRR